MTADTSSIPGYYLQFASDNAAGVCPEALAAMNEANSGFAASYGNDDATKLVCDRLRELFETDAEVFFVLNGTAANSVTLAALCQPYQAVICTDTSHVETDECGAPEFFSSGSKLLLSPHRQGKLTSAGVLEVITRRTDIHYPRPKVVTLTQSTELGTLYHKGEVSSIARVAQAHGLKVHMDGARFANAVAAHAREERLTFCRAVQHGVSDDDVPRRISRELGVGPDNNATTGQALANVIIGFAD